LYSLFYARATRHNVPEDSILPISFKDAAVMRSSQNGGQCSADLFASVVGNSPLSSQQGKTTEYIIAALLFNPVTVPISFFCSSLPFLYVHLSPVASFLSSTLK
jgi:hypothetical protein